MRLSRPPASAPAVTPAHRPPGGPASARPDRRGRALPLVVLLGIVVALVVVRTTVAFPVRVASASMQPTLGPGDVVLVTRRAPGVDDLHRGDLVTFRSPEDGRRALKRVLGEYGFTVAESSDGLRLRHGLLDKRTQTIPPGRVQAVPAGMSVASDSRQASRRSR